MTRLTLVASDMDGTFLNADHSVSDENIAAMRRAAAAGVHVVFATGRPARWLGPLKPLVDIAPLVLASNGAVRYDLVNDTVLSFDPIDVDVMREVVADIRAHDESAHFAVEHPHDWSREPAYPDHPILPQEYRVGPIEDAFDEPVVKLLVRSPLHPSDELGAMITDIVGDRLTVTWSFVTHPGLLEVSAKGVSKASGLQAIFDQLHLDPAEAAAFGDMPNDLEMLALVGRPFAMSNGHTSVLEQGYPMAGHHGESAVGRTINRLLDEAGL